MTKCSVSCLVRRVVPPRAFSIPFLLVLAAALLLPGAALAANSGGSFEYRNGFYIGKYASTGNASGGEVVIKEDFYTSDTGPGEDLPPDTPPGDTPPGDRPPGVMTDVQVAGGVSETGDATGNSVTMTGGTMADVMGGSAEGAGNASDNRVTIGGGGAQNVTGGKSASGTATGNTVTISGGTVGSVQGGAAKTTATGNQVTISGGTVTGDVTGGLTTDSAGTGTGNTVTISGGTVGGTVYGARASDTRGENHFSGNTLHMNAAPASIGGVENFETVNFTYSGNANIKTLTTYSGQNTGINTNTNLVTFDGVVSGAGAITKNGTGTLVLSGANTYTGGTTVSAGLLQGTTSSIQGNVNNNAAVTFAQAANGTYAGVMSGTGSLTKIGAGTLTLSGANTYRGMTTVQSGTLSLGGGSLASKDLTLHDGTTFERGSFRHSLNSGSLTVNGQRTSYSGDLSATGATLNFLAPTGAVNNPLLSVSGKANISNSVINFGIKGGEAPGTSTYTLLQSSGALTAPGLTKGGGIVGLERVYTYELEATPNTLLAHTESRETDSAVSKSPAEGNTVSVVLVSQGADLISNAGIASAKAVSVKASTAKASTVKASTAAAASLGVTSFGAMSGGTSRYNTGSHVNVDSLSLMAGFAKTWQTPGMDVLGGVFFEAGWGSFNTYNSLQGGGTFQGKGNSSYYGGGLLGRVDVTDNALAGLYVEASLRMGGLMSDYRSDRLPGGNGERASYDSSATYYGAHAGLGYILGLSDKVSLDLYGKYFWNHTTSMNLTILGSQVDMEAVNSHRTRVGGRLSYSIHENFAPYVGAAWEYEFDGTARSVVAGRGAPAPSLKGSTGVGELGLTWKPAQDSSLSVDLGVTGYVGMRQGVSGNLQIKFEF